MAIDMRRVAEAAIEAAIKEATLGPKPKKRRLSTGRALLVGAGLATAGRIAAGPKAREMFGRVRERIADADLFGEEPSDEVTDDDEELEDEGEYEDEPDAEAEDDFEAEDDDFEEDDEFEEDEADEERPRGGAG